MARRKTNVMALKEQLDFNGSDEKFLELINLSLENRAPLFRTVFEMYYGINREPVHPKVIPKVLSLPPGNVSQIRKLVLDLCRKDLSKNSVMQR